jgi:hypothetical protein
MHTKTELDVAAESYRCSGGTTNAGCLSALA